MRILWAIATLPYKVRLRERDRPFAPILRRAPTLHRFRRHPLFFCEKKSYEKKGEERKVVAVELSFPCLFSFQKFSRARLFQKGRKRTPALLPQKGPAKQLSVHALPTFSLAEKGAKKKLRKRNADRGVSRGAPREPRLRLDNLRAFEKARAKLLAGEMGGALREKREQSLSHN
jgi:hypothetical protein